MLQRHVAQQRTPSGRISEGVAGVVAALLWAAVGFGQRPAAEPTMTAFHHPFAHSGAAVAVRAGNLQSHALQQLPLLLVVPLPSARPYTRQEPEPDGHESGRVIHSRYQLRFT